MGMSPKRVAEICTRNAVAIYNWIEQNKHKYKRGITSSAMFSEVVVDSYGEPYGKNMDIRESRYNAYCGQIMRMKRKGYLRQQVEVPGGPRVWSVNEEMLPAGTVTYTGVRNPIPMAEPPRVLEPVSVAPTTEQAEAFVLEELKQIKIDCAVVHRQGVAMELDSPTLYQLYKLGQVLNEVTEPAKEDNEQARVEQQEQELPSVPEAEDTPEYQTPSDSSAPF